MNALFIWDCTWLNMLHMLNYMLIKYKNIFECFSLKVQLVYKTLWTFRPPINKLPIQA